jgi:hypothetical protein
VEKTMGAWLTEAEAHETQSCGTHNAAYSPVPVGAVSGDLEVRSAPDSVVDVEGLL